ncbi:MAG: hypothetical protein A2Y40_09565 [Candidatus Margulisbacteria bacterium GWF2_35_9]|nr:MAG: hypothetical protein A2Y40_09565 [Candidatus Margulisbacteria bacterium GWF2_35_9]
MSNIKETFQFYNDLVKPLYCEIEAENNELPVELLFEIHAAFDHLKRFFLEEEKEDISCEKAISHLKRGALDTFKLKLKNYNTELQQLLKSNIDFEIIDSGNFYPELLSKRKEIVKKAKEARLLESNKDKDKAFDTWTEVSLLIDDFKDNYFDGNKIDWAKKKTKRIFRKEIIISFLIGLTTGIIILIIDKIDLITKIISFLKPILTKN